MVGNPGKAGKSSAHFEKRLPIHLKHSYLTNYGPKNHEPALQLLEGNFYVTDSVTSLPFFLPLGM